MNTLERTINSLTPSTVKRVIDRIAFGANGTGQYKIRICVGVHDPEIFKNFSSEEKLKSARMDGCTGLFITGKGGRLQCEHCYRQVTNYGYTPVESVKTAAKPKKRTVVR